MAIIHLISGLPGSGKTTKCKELAKLCPLIRMSPDEWMQASGISLRDASARESIEELQFKLALVLLDRGIDVAIEWGTWSRIERIEILLAAKERGHEVKGYFLNPPIEVLRQRLDIRDRELPESDQVLVSELELIFTMFELPESEEMSLYSEVWFDKPTADKYKSWFEISPPMPNKLGSKRPTRVTRN